MPAKTQPQKYGDLWTREELILAFDLYCRIPFKKTKANNPDVVELARLLRRSPASVARKLGNFGSFDPQLRRQRISGLAHASKLDADIWNEFNSNWNQLVLNASQLRIELGAEAKLEPAFDSSIRIPHGPSEKEEIRKNRIHQAFFRETILSS